MSDSVVTYTVSDSTPGYLSRQGVLDEIGDAFAMWSAASGVKFETIPGPEEGPDADITVDWCGPRDVRFDGPGGALAKADSKSLTFDAREAQTPGASGPWRYMAPWPRPAHGAPSRTPATGRRADLRRRGGRGFTRDKPLRQSHRPARLARATPSQELASAGRGLSLPLHANTGARARGEGAMPDRKRRTRPDERG